MIYIIKISSSIFEIEGINLCLMKTKLWFEIKRLYFFYIWTSSTMYRLINIYNYKLNTIKLDFCTNLLLV